MGQSVPLWCKSNFSFLEGASHPEELVETAAALGLEAVALTDRDGVHGIVDLVEMETDVRDAELVVGWFTLLQRLELVDF